MKDTSVIILCAGHQERWGDISCKHLVPIDKEPLLFRTVKQCKKIFGVEPVVATQNPLLDKLSRHKGYESHIPFMCRWTVETLSSTLDQIIYYPGGNPLPIMIVLLGDVYYTDVTLRVIKKGNTLVYGDSYEIYGLKLCNHNRARVALKKAIAHAEEGGTGKLWEFYRAYIDIPMMPHVEWLDVEFTFIDDETQDFDTYEEYKQFIANR